MCNFFSCIVTRNGEVLFTEEDSHEEVIGRSGLKDDLEHFVRVEYNSENGYAVDEKSIPDWYERIAVMAEQNVKQVFDKVNLFKKEYNKIKQLAWDEYNKIKQLARDEYNKIEQPALDEYAKIVQLAWDEYKLQLNKIVGYIGRG